MERRKAAVLREGESGTAPGRNHGDRPYESRGSQLAEADGRKTESCRNP